MSQTDSNPNATVAAASTAAPARSTLLVWLDRLNLEPQERRLVLGGLVVVALVLNYWIVWPYFGEWSKLSTEMEKAERRRSQFASETGKKPAYEKQLQSLQKTGAGGVLEEEQANRVQSSIYTEAATRGVTIARLTPNRALSQTNAFFDEVSMTVEVLAGEGEFVDFLHSLGAGDSMIRVRELNRLRLDPSQTRLQATMTLVASFQKKPKAPVAPPTKKSVQPAGAPKVAPGTATANKAATNKPAKK